jgi:hypothetical protein
VAQDRCATFDCYGTLIAGTAGFAVSSHAIEPTPQVGGARSYREVMTAAMPELGAPANEVSALADELPSSDALPEVRRALETARDPGRAHWARFFEETGAPREKHVHVAQSHFHDITPAMEFPETLDELVTA